jgi:dienelactone hydrolase
LAALLWTTVFAGVNDVADFASAPAMAFVTLAPDGNHLSYVRQSQGEQWVIVRSLHSAREWRTLIVTMRNERIRWCGWADAERLLCGTLSTVRRPDRISEHTQLYVIEARTRRVRMLTAKLTSALRDQVIDLTARGGSVLLQHDPIGNGYPEVAELDLRSGALQKRVGSHPPISRWMSDGRGIVRLGMGVESDVATLTIRDGASGPWQVMLRASLTDPNAFAPLAFGSKLNELYALGHHEGRAALFVLDPAHVDQRRLLLADPTYDVDGPLLFHPQTRALLAATYTTRHEVQHFFDARAAQSKARIDAKLPGAINVIQGIVADGQLQLVRSVSDTNPPSYYSYDARADALALLGHTYSVLEGRTLAPVRAVTYRARDGEAIPAYLTLPLPSAHKSLPSVVLPHGGPETRVTQEFDPLVQFLAAQGYAVLEMNFRGSFGYGAKFAAAGAGQWGGVIHNDITDGTRWLIEQGIADPGRICIVGESFGGYAALLGAVRESQWYACAVSFGGVADLMAFAQHTRRLQSSAVWSERLGNDPRALWQMSPLPRVWATRTPILLMHGRKDAVVPVSQSRRFARELRKSGKTHRYIESIACDHDMTAQPCRHEFFQQMQQFLASYLGTAATEP